MKNKSTKNKKKKNFLLSLGFRPSFLKNLYILTAVVFVWRGLWGLMDLYLFPGNPGVSFFVGMIVGLLLLYLPDEDLKELL